ncbi:MAG TPA: hypothetical protein DCK81_00850 [Clostridiales bacterium UBA9856]|nr:hypothetical protein [Clostridiales bacterium UBA9856]
MKNIKGNVANVVIRNSIDNFSQGYNNTITKVIVLSTEKMSCKNGLIDRADIYSPFPYRLE